MTNRRGFFGAMAGGVGLGAWAWAKSRPTALPRFTPPPVPPSAGMPGPFPGRVVEVFHPDAVRGDGDIQRPAVAKLVERGMCELTGADHAVDGWRRLFERGDVVGIKVNPVGKGRGPGIVPSISSPELLLEVVRGLKSAGVAAQDIIVFDRYAVEFIDAGYLDVLNANELDGVRWLCASSNGNLTQLEIDGVVGDTSPELRRHIAGYDPDAFVEMAFCAPEHDPKDDRRFRSHLTTIVSRMVNKLVTLPVLKDHRSAGVTISLKNMSHGLNNNVARSHIAGIAHGWPGSAADFTGPNQCNTFIPTAVNQPAIRAKATLHICDGLIGVYEGGPGSWNATWATWPYRSLFFATDPVALDHVGWDVVDAKRQSIGWRKVADMGRATFPPELIAAAYAASGADPMALARLNAWAVARHFDAGRGSEVFERRQPEHIYLASTLGLGRFDRAQIEHVKVRLSQNG